MVYSNLSVLMYNQIMKKILSLLLFLIIISQPSFASDKLWKLSLQEYFNNDSREIKSLLHSQVKYANKTNFEKFISTYDDNYINADGFNLESYSNLVRDIWQTYDNIEYDIKIKNISVDNDSAIAELVETSYAEIPVSENMDGVLRSEANSVYYLKKVNGAWKVASDSVISEVTSMLYGEAKNLDIKLTVPTQISANTEYSAALEFVPPANSIAIASIASDKIEYPQQQTKEVFRKFPDDNILERLFRSNSDNVNEYVVASIGLTRANVTDVSIKLRLTGFGYQIARVNVVPQNRFIKNEVNEKNVKDE